ncbi:MAG: hypothetical protein DYG92_04745 [Leptolyngbya sp. PLA1]|nr:hypothetical protein [Leptolyngbya sp. PLA1]
MRTEEKRRLASTAVIGVAALLGVRLFWVEPARARAGDGLARIEQARAEAQRLADTVAAAPDRMDDARRAEAQAALIRRASLASGSEGAAFETLEQLARQSEVHLEQVHPRRSEGPTQAGKNTANRDAWFRTTVTVHGTYDGVTRFVARLAGHQWYARVQSGMLVPKELNGSDSVIATFELEHLGPELAPTVESGGEE